MPKVNRLWTVLLLLFTVSIAIASQCIADLPDLAPRRTHESGKEISISSDSDTATECQGTVRTRTTVSFTSVTLTAMFVAAPPVSPLCVSLEPVNSTSASASVFVPPEA